MQDSSIRKLYDVREPRRADNEFTVAGNDMRPRSGKGSSGNLQDLGHKMISDIHREQSLAICVQKKRRLAVVRARERAVVNCNAHGNGNDMRILVVRVVKNV